MIKLTEIPAVLYLAFMITYLTAGDRDSQIWSGLFFCMNYIVLGVSALKYKSEIIQNVILSVSITMFAYTVIKYIFSYDFEKQFILILLVICIFGFYKLQKFK